MRISTRESKRNLSDWWRIHNNWRHLLDRRKLSPRRLYWCRCDVLEHRRFIIRGGLSVSADLFRLLSRPRPQYGMALRGRSRSLECGHRRLCRRHRDWRHRLLLFLRLIQRFLCWRRHNGICVTDSCFGAVHPLDRLGSPIILILVNISPLRLLLGRVVGL